MAASWEAAAFFKLSTRSSYTHETDFGNIKRTAAYHMPLCANCGLQAATYWLFPHLRWHTWHQPDPMPSPLQSPLCETDFLRRRGETVIRNLQRMLQDHNIVQGF